MKTILKTNKKPFLALMIITIFIAGLLDIKYKGLLFQLLPDTVKSYLADII
ncbi:hypothetical protein [Oceanobacillus zhaokaii]|uniref:hypothetical protein n=1 Tax=Oceanobacillus zhaokaii TaxID=2052660 RepID=UPI001966AC11|nr:hypothetical protein [Oceanobacillus zhaokaii]